MNALGTVPGLLVTARTSAFAFKGEDKPVPEIAEALGVAHVVEGSVRRAGDTIRVTARLVRAADGFQLWQASYDRAAGDAFDVQTEIAGNVAEALGVALDEGARRQMAILPDAHPRQCRVRPRAGARPRHGGRLHASLGPSPAHPAGSGGWKSPSRHARG
jgi:hypothetical protein